MTRMFKEITTLQYMGSKSRIINEVCAPIVENERINTVVDLFAGTGTIGFALKPYVSVYSNDLEYYAYVLNEGILNGCHLAKNQETSILSSMEVLQRTLFDLYAPAIQKEQQYLDEQCEHSIYRSFCEQTPSVLYLSTTERTLDCILAVAKDIVPGTSFQKVAIPALFVTYYANTYFGIRQCCEIDAIRGCISGICSEQIQKVLLSALMAVMSYTASTTTHFAQYLKINSPATCKNIIAKRSLKIFDLFKKKLEEFRDEGILDADVPIAVCSNVDYLELLNRIPLDETVMVYADPPYFKEHYSRYYHILNTVCRYDYPAIDLNNQTKEYTIGRYRENRNVSDFGKRKTALRAFEELVTVCAKNNSWLTISYSDNSIVKIHDVLKNMKVAYDVEVKEIPLKHSKQGRVSTSDVHEFLIIGRPLSVKKTIGQKQVSDLLAKLSFIKPVSDNPAGLMHNYMARKPFNIVSPIIEQLCPEDGIVFDPMFGSGTTLIEASKLGRRAVGADINPQAYKIAQVSLKKWDLDQVEREIEQFYVDVSKKCTDIYKFETSGEIRIIERCHFDKVDGDLIPTRYWYKTLLNNRLTSRKCADATADFITAYEQFANQTIEHFTDKPLIPNSRIAIGSDDTVFMYFCGRNLVALDTIMETLECYSTCYGYPVLELMVSSAINLIRLSDKKASSQMPYWTPKINVTSRNAVMVLEDKKKKLISGLRYLESERHFATVSTFVELASLGGILLKTTPAQKLSYKVLPKDSVDLVLTDPPYTDQVPYLEYSQLWSSILGWDKQVIDDLEHELVVSDAPSRNKDLGDFNRVFDEILRRTEKSLKYGGHFAMFYHSFDLKSWSYILSVMKKNGFAYQGQAPIAAPRKSFKTVMSPKSTLDGHYVIVFRKRNIHEPVFDGTILEAKEQAIRCAIHIIRSRESTTSQDLYDCGMLKDAIEKGYLSLLADKYKTFLDIIAPHFNYVNGFWEEKKCIGC